MSRRTELQRQASLRRLTRDDVDRDGIDAAGSTGTYERPGPLLSMEQLERWRNCTRAEAIRQADDAHSSLQSLHTAIDSLRLQVRSRDATIVGLRLKIEAAKEALT